jgi:phage terminase small subunit
VDPGGRKVNEGPRFVRDAPDPPAWLDREAKAEWHRVVPELVRLKLQLVS